MINTSFQRLANYKAIINGNCSICNSKIFKGKFDLRIFKETTLCYVLEMSINISNNVCSMVGIVIDRDMTMHIIENENNPINMHF